MQKALDRLQVLLDAKTLGITIRNLAAMTNYDADAAKQMRAIQQRIMARYGSHDVRGCELKLAMILRERI